MRLKCWEVKNLICIDSKFKTAEIYVMKWSNETLMMGYVRQWWYFKIIIVLKTISQSFSNFVQQIDNLKTFFFPALFSDFPIYFTV